LWRGDRDARPEHGERRVLRAAPRDGPRPSDEGREGSTPQRRLRGGWLAPPLRNRGREKPSSERKRSGACAVGVPIDAHREVREIVSALRKLCPKGHDT